ncbi:MAG: ATP-dependent Clp protease adapter ClpS [Desulfobulbus sp.]|nr:ATP-dependent Clp protease adapter ClpS [Desulfobulbus sp.]
MTKDDSFIQDTVENTNQESLQEPPLYKVLLHNDDYTTMDFVVMILETVFHKNTDEATRIMLNVHHQGVGIAGVYTRELGETKVEIVHRMARRNLFPLRCSLERSC